MRGRMGEERSRRNLVVVAAALAVAAVAVVLVIVLSGDDESSSTAAPETAATAPAPTGPNERGNTSEEQERNGDQAANGLTPAPGTPEQREREISPRLRQRVAGAGLETVRVRGGAPVGGLVRLVYEQGDRVQLRILADRVERFSIPNLGLAARGGPPRGAHFDFIAPKSGLFAVEMRKGGSRRRVAVLVIH